MEEREKYKLRLKSLTNAVSGFELLMKKNISGYDDIITDGLMNGRIQKFEYCTELLWKNIKRFLWVVDGVDVSTPKSAIKQFYVVGYIKSDEFEILYDMIEDRNILSHIYREEDFLEIHSRLEKYLPIMKKVIKIISVS